MSDDALNTSAVPVTRETFADYCRNTVSAQAIQVVQWRNTARRSTWNATMAWSLAICFAAIILSLLPLKEYVPVFVYMDANGMPSTATTISDLPSDTQVAGIESLLWNYLRHREHYSLSEAPESYDIVSALSSDAVRDMYQRWANPKLNKDAPAAKLGKQGSVRIYRRHGTWVGHDPEYRTGVFKIAYCQVTTIDGQGVYAQPKIASMRYEIFNRIPLIHRVTSNPHGVIVTEYPGPEPEGPLRAIQPGSATPCG